jgi:hypothetical protein
MASNCVNKMNSFSSEMLHFGIAVTLLLLLCIRYLLRNDGLFVGSSSAMNCVGAVRVAQSIGPGHTIVTILCDSGMRHLSKFYDAQYLSQYGLAPSATGLQFLGPS